MSKKSNVHPDYYKTAGRDRQDDAAAARQSRTVAKGRVKPDRYEPPGRDRPNRTSRATKSRAVAKSPGRSATPAPAKRGSGVPKKSRKT